MVYVWVSDGANLRHIFVLHKLFTLFLSFYPKFSTENIHFVNSDFANLDLNKEKSAKENYLALVSFQVLKNVKKN